MNHPVKPFHFTLRQHEKCKVSKQVKKKNRRKTVTNRPFHIVKRSRVLYAFIIDGWFLCNYTSTKAFYICKEFYESHKILQRIAKEVWKRREKNKTKKSWFPFCICFFFLFIIPIYHGILRTMKAIFRFFFTSAVSSAIKENVCENNTVCVWKRKGGKPCGIWNDGRYFRIAIPCVFTFPELT